ncbi:ComEC/Rec2 family competence protein [Actibacterium sp. XHP0104]|uniref:ComEC/Rec2 family competence protein n=1 Tax=Actibacterium sp. XHP0104 TaxID=2984335 RepID=UPI0021E91C54|nr:ComEC/Rec2 family competence protein [Actibacterium sp. XHP0104]MCV2880867.1 ComEC family competence protein [Actibacterium sp. XHP0104]
MARALEAIEAQRGHLFPWVPVGLALGIGAYFALPSEPGGAAWAVLACALAVGMLIWLRVPDSWAPPVLMLVLMLAGLGLAGLRTAQVGAPVLPYRIHGPVEGRIVAIDRSQSHALRLTLDRVWIGRVAPAKTPARIRVSLHAPPAGFDPAPGQVIGLTAMLSPPPGPAEPGGFSFRRMAYFDRLGAVGYARVPPVLLDRAEGGVIVALHRARLGLSKAIRARLPGDKGAFAAAILTGDRSAITQDTVQALRDANMAHLLAISGLHMGLLTGVVFSGLRMLMALVPPLALHWPTRKIAAIGALAAAVVYLALSGGNVATQRAFIMVAVMLGAVLADRRALTLRAVALAAVIVLCLQPESLTEPGFQMSFAATTALVAVFGALRGWPEGRWQPPRWMRPVLAVVLSSAVAGAATGPIGAAHFNQVAQYGLLANVVSVPLMGLWVIPLALIAGLVAPLGLSGVALTAMGWGIGWILGVARWVAGLDGATWPVVAPGGWVLPLMALGALWLILWRGWARWSGLAPVLVAAALWPLAERPALLIAESGGLMGVMTSEGRALSKPRGDGFVAGVWLENDGDAAGQEAAFTRYAPEQPWHTTVAGQIFVHLGGRGWRDQVAQACALGVVVARATPEQPLPEGCQFWGPRQMAASGAVAVYPGADGPRIVTARQREGRRPWVQ